MPNSQDVQVPLRQKIAAKVYQGPSLAAPFAAVVAELDSPHPDTLPARQIVRLLEDTFPIAAQLPLVLPDDGIDFAALAAALAVAWQDPGGRIVQAHAISRLENGAVRIAVGYLNSDMAAIALQAGIEVANAVFARASDATAGVSALQPMLRPLAATLRARRFANVTLAFFKAARARGIPIYELCPGANAVACGQGARSLHFLAAGSSDNSYTGCMLSTNKAMSNALVCRLGFPGVEHRAVSNLADARAAAQKLGFPLVVKPIDRNGATGVTAGIDTMAELDVAFAVAKPLSRSGPVLVERLVPGDDHRLTVFGGTFHRAGRLLPPVIVGDGRRSIAELIDADNIRRREAIAAADYVYELSVDARMIALLRKQGLSLDYCPPGGVELQLSTTSNLITGGTRENLTHRIHPDNVAMAEDLARSFRLDAVGIDFITPDISKSWREVPCAIIELNHNPGTSAEMAMAVIRDKFPPGNDGRIPSILVVGGMEEEADRYAQRLEAAGKRVGRTNGALTQLAGRRRFHSSTNLPDRIMGLLLNSACEALVVSCTPDEIVEYGLPPTRFDIAVLASSETMRADMRQLIASNALNCVERAAPGPADGTILTLIDKLVGCA